jgi:hypothetical protein
VLKISAHIKYIENRLWTDKEGGNSIAVCECRNAACEVGVCVLLARKHIQCCILTFKLKREGKKKEKVLCTALPNT